MFRIMRNRQFTCEIYVDGRIHIELPSKPSIFEHGIAGVLKKMADTGQFESMEPGRYRVTTKRENGSSEIELLPIN